MVKKKVYPTEGLKYLIYKKQCMTCGKMFDARVRAKDGTIMDGAGYFDKITFGLGMWSKCRMDSNPDGSIKWTRIIPRWKELWHRLIDLKKRILHQYTEVEMWECPRCMKNGREKWRRQEKRNANSNTRPQTIQTT